MKFYLFLFLLNLLILSSISKKMKMKQDDLQEKLEAAIEYVDDFKRDPDAPQIEDSSSEAIVEIAKGRLLSPQILIDLMQDISNTYKKEKTIVEIEVPREAKITFIGDLLGNYKDLLRILKNKGFPSAKNYYLFTGNYLEIGEYGIEVLSTVLLLKKNFPDYIFLTRGNHEDCLVNNFYGIERSFFMKTLDLFLYANCAKIFDEITKLYSTLPIGYIVNKKIFAVHGGIHRNYSFRKLTDLSKMKRNYLSFYFKPQSELDIADLLWSAPLEGDFYWPFAKIKQNKRIRPKVGIDFNQQALDLFLKKNNLQLIIRSNQFCKNGYDLKFYNIITLFSSSHYMDHDNAGAIATISGKKLKKKDISSDDFEFLIYRPLNDNYIVFDDDDDNY